MSFLLTSAAVVGGLLLGRLLGRRLRAKADRASDAKEEPATDGPSKDAEPAKSAAAENPATPPSELLAHVPFKLGEVLVRAGGAEAWLAGALVFLEETPLAALFVAPDAGGDKAIYARVLPSREVVWLESVEPHDAVTFGEPSVTVEIGRTRFERVRRLPVRVATVGESVPCVGSQAVLAEYHAEGGERLVVVVGSETTRAFRGVVLEAGMYDVLPAPPSDGVP